MHGLLIFVNKLEYCALGTTPEIGYR